MFSPFSLPLAFFLKHIQIIFFIYEDEKIKMENSIDSNAVFGDNLIPIFHRSWGGCLVVWPSHVCKSSLETGLSENSDSQEMWLFIAAGRNLMSSEKILPQPQRIQVYKGSQKAEFTRSVCCTHTNLVSFKFWHFSKAQSHPHFR